MARVNSKKRYGDKAIWRKIEKLNKKLIRYSKKVDKYIERQKPRPLFLEIKKKQNETNAEILRLLTIILEHEDKDFKKIATANYKLLLYNAFKFKTTQKGGAITGSHAKTMYGYLHKNGCIYCETQTTNWGNLSYPTRMEGHIDCIGNVNIETVKKGYNYIHSVPLEFAGKISENGKVILDTTDLDIDLFSNGRDVVSNIIGSPFLNRKDDLKAFWENRLKLIMLINQYRVKNNLHVLP